MRCLYCGESCQPFEFYNAGLCLVCADDVVDLDWVEVLDGRYKVNRYGQVRNTKKGRYVKGQNNRGYLLMRLEEHGVRTRYPFHRLIWGAFNGSIPDGLILDHINRNPADNRLENLRLVTPKQNGQNRSRKSRTTKIQSHYIGVNYVETGVRQKRWRAKHNDNGKHRCTYHSCDTAAALARDRLVIQFSDDPWHVSLNFPKLFFRDV